jgi:PAS domain-containing protein
MPDWLPSILIAAVAMFGGVVGEKLRQRVAEREADTEELLAGAALAERIRLQVESEVGARFASIEALRDEAMARADAAETALDQLMLEFTALRAEHDDLRRLVGDDQSGLAVIDAAGRYLYINEAGARMNGVGMEDHMGRKPIDLFPGLAYVIDPIIRHVIGEMEMARGVITDKDGRDWSYLYKPVITETSNGPMGIAMVGHFRLIPKETLL